jgi:two-component sensor histidine kinase
MLAIYDATTYRFFVFVQPYLYGIVSKFGIAGALAMARDIDALLRQQAALAQFGTFAFQETSLLEVLNAAARICAQSFNVDCAKICRYREAENDLLIEAGYGWKAGVVGKVISKADESSPQGRAFMTRLPVVVRDLTAPNDYHPSPLYAEHNIVSTVDVVIKSVAGPPFGVLEVDSSLPITYDEHDVNFLTGFANVLAEAVATHQRNETLHGTLIKMQALVADKDRLLEERATLSQELQHRVRNNLQLVNGMLDEQVRHTTDASSQRGLQAIIRRVTILAQVYDHLLGVGMYGALDFGVYTASLCASLPELQGNGTRPINLVCEANDLKLDLGSVTALGLVISELVSNSYEHAFPTGGGTIRVSVMKDDKPDRGVVTIKDDGVGYAPAPETKRHGVGLARRLMAQVGGTLDVVNKTGTTWTLRFPTIPPEVLASA